MGEALPDFVQGGEVVAARLPASFLDRRQGVGFADHELNAIADLVRQHWQKLWDGWHEYFGA